MNYSPRSTRTPNPDDLLVLLAVSRHRKFTEAADSLGLNHTTVSRRISRLESDVGGKVIDKTLDGWQLTNFGMTILPSAEEVEQAVLRISSHVSTDESVTGTVRISATDGFSAYVLSRVAAACQVSYPHISIEILTATRPALVRRSGFDIEVVVGKPESAPGETVLLSPYDLGLYASKEYLSVHGKPKNYASLAKHPLVYFVASVLSVDALTINKKLTPHMMQGLSSTNVFVQVEATREGAGIGLLPCFMAEQHPDLVRILPGEIHERLEYWMVVHFEAQKQAAVTVVAHEIIKQAFNTKNILMP